MNKKYKKFIVGFSSLLALSFLSGCQTEHTHQYKEATYTWASDYSKCTARRVCIDDETHYEEEVTKSSYELIKDATCSEEGLGRYTATFYNEAFAKQTYDLAIASHGHTWDKGYVTSLPSILEDGAITYHCLECDAVKTEKIDKIVDVTSYTVDANRVENLTGVYKAKAVVGHEKSTATLGIPEISKLNLQNYPTYVSPGIIQGAAVEYEVKTGPVSYEPIPGRELVAPYSYFRYSITDVETKDADGNIKMIKKLSGFDGTYYIIRVDLTDLIKDKTGFLHVKQENNKALMVALGMQGQTAFADGMGIKVASYSLANNAAALKDTTGDDQQTPYLDVIVLSSGKLAAGADAGKEGAPTSDISLSFYIDETDDYNPSLVYDPASTDVNHVANVIKKFFDETKAVEGTNATSYLVKGSDLEIDVEVDETKEEANKNEFWSLTKAMYYQGYNDHTIKLVSEVPVLEGLQVAGTAESARKVILDVNSFDIQIANHVESEVAGLTVSNNASLEILDNSNTVGAELAIGNNATMEIQDGGTLIIDESCQLEVEYDAASVVHDTTHYPIAEVIAKIEALPNPADVKEADRININAAKDAFDALTVEEQEQVTNKQKLLDCLAALPPEAPLTNGEITIKNGGKLINEGIINIEGLEVKPAANNQQEQSQVVDRDMKTASLLVEEGGIIDNYGCMGVKGELYILGELNNYGEYDSIIKGTDPDKGTIDHHRGIQVYWKDDVTVLKEGTTDQYEINPDVRPGVIYVGLDRNKTVTKTARLRNYGDIILCPGTIQVYGQFANLKSETRTTGGMVCLCDMSEAIVPITPTQENPNQLEERRQFSPAYKSIFNVLNANLFVNEGRVEHGQIELVGNGLFGKLTILLQ